MIAFWFFVSHFTSKHSLKLLIWEKSVPVCLNIPICFLFLLGWPSSVGINLTPCLKLEHLIDNILEDNKRPDTVGGCAVGIMCTRNHYYNIVCRWNSINTLKIFLFKKECMVCLVLYPAGFLVHFTLSPFFCSSVFHLESSVVQQRSQTLSQKSVSQIAS